MLKKVYVKIKEIIINNCLFIVGFIIGFLIFTTPLPYFINAPGGISDVSEKINIEGYEIEKDVFNLTYVYEYRATIPLLIYSYFNKEWQIIPKSDVVLNNETIEDDYKRNRILLNSANQNAIYIAYKTADMDVEILKSKIFIIYVDETSKTDLKVGDEIISLQGIEVFNLSEFKTTITNFHKNEKIKIQVKRDDEIIETTSELIKFGNELLIGVRLANEKELKIAPKINFNFKNSESGPSGGLMMSLAIYYTLTGKEFEKGYKVAGTGTIDEDGKVGQIGGIKYKILAAAKEKVDVFLSPDGENYEEALKVKNEYNLNLEIKKITTLEEAILYLNKNN